MSALATTDSDEEALLSMLGLPNLSLSSEEVPPPPEQQSIDELSTTVPQSHFTQLSEAYATAGIVELSTPSLKPFFPSASTMRLITNEIHYAENPAILRTNETVATSVLTRLENFVPHHDTWKSVCGTNGALSVVLGEVFNTPPWPLYKEKLNLKPPGGKGFAPHLDAPSLQQTGLADDFVTVMIAIDDMTSMNGCLEVVKGEWNENNCVKCEVPEGNNPDGNGRLGAIHATALPTLTWEKIPCDAGSVYLFSGYIPHRSNYNYSLLSRRAVFLTYNNPKYGEQRSNYYNAMQDLRDEYREIAMAKKLEEKDEVNWLTSIPS
jgi:hypothetical protein